MNDSEPPLPDARTTESELPKWHRPKEVASGVVRFLVTLQALESLVRELIHLLR